MRFYDGVNGCAFESPIRLNGGSSILGVAAVPLDLRDLTPCGRIEDEFQACRRPMIEASRRQMAIIPATSFTSAP